MLEVGLISASPKMSESASGYIIDELKAILDLDEGLKTSKYYIRKQEAFEKELGSILGKDILVFAFPLYVDGVPSHLLGALKIMEESLRDNPRRPKTIYAISNAGFYEGIQNQIALEILENWAVRQGFKWGQGLGIGAGGMLLGIKNIKTGHRLKVNFYKVLNELSENIKTQAQAENIYIEMNIPRFLYKLVVEGYWRRRIKKNGLKVRDLNRRLS